MRLTVQPFQTPPLGQWYVEGCQHVVTDPVRAEAGQKDGDWFGITGRKGDRFDAPATNGRKEVPQIEPDDDRLCRVRCGERADGVAGAEALSRLVGRNEV